MLPYDIKVYLDQPNPTKKNVVEAIKIMCKEQLIFSEVGFLHTEDYVKFMKYLIENFDKDTYYIKQCIYNILANNYDTVYLKILNKLGIQFSKKQSFYILGNILQSYRNYYHIGMEEDMIDNIANAIIDLKIDDFKVFENDVYNIYDLYNFVRIFETAGISIQFKDINKFFVKALEKNDYAMFGQHDTILNFIKHLIKKYNLDVRTKLPRIGNETLLHLSVYNHDFELFRILYSRSNLTAKNVEGYTAIDQVIEDNIINLAEHRENTIFYNFLIKNKAISDIAAASVLKRSTRIPPEIKYNISGYLGFGRENVIDTQSKKGKGWNLISKKLNRDKMPSKYFLIPSEKKFPVYTQNGKLSCKGIQSAILRSRMLYGKTHDVKYKKVLNKALKLLKQFNCSKI